MEGDPALRRQIFVELSCLLKAPHKKRTAFETHQTMRTQEFPIYVQMYIFLKIEQATQKRALILQI